MPIKPEQARALLPRVDPARIYAGRPVGLRDGAVLASLAAGLSAEEVLALRASAVSASRGKLWVHLRRHGITWLVLLPPDLGGRLLAWLSDRRLWGTTEPVFTSPEGIGSTAGIYRVLNRYKAKAPRPS